MIMSRSVGTYLGVEHHREGREVHSWEIGRYDKEALLQTIVRNARQYEKLQHIRTSGKISLTSRDSPPNG
jgi:hypothetical protein